MAVASFPIPSTPVIAGQSFHPVGFVNVTSQVAGHTEYQVTIDLAAWTSADHCSVGIEFRIDSNPTIVQGCGLTALGGTYTAMDGTTKSIHSCGEKLPVFTTKLEARAWVTVPSAGTISGSINLT